LLVQQAAQGTVNISDVNDGAGETGSASAQSLRRCDEPGQGQYVDQA
jgi:hypothetical protein